jgi:hypothetical protein
LEVQVLPDVDQGKLSEAVYIRIADDPRAHRVPVVGDAQDQ